MLKPTHLIAAAAGIVIVVLLALGIHKDAQGKFIYRLGDKKPEITLTWSPQEGPINLRDATFKLRITDDHNIDFASYRFTIVELEKTLDFPVEGLVGREWEQPMSLSLVADNEKLVGKDSVTLRVLVSDDVGQTAELEKTIPLKK